MSWHVDRTTLTKYRDGDLTSVGCSSVEAHLVACAECRDEVAGLVPMADLDAAWGEVVTTIAAPEAGWLERALRKLGVAEPLAHLVGVTPSLRGPWLVGVAVTVLAAVLLSHLGDGAALFVMVAPLVPVAGVAVAFGPGVDPTYELLVVAPIRGFDLLMARAAAVLATTVPVLALASLAVPAAGGEAAAWLLPALALTALTLAVGSWVVPWKAAATLCALWIAPVTVNVLGLRPEPIVVETLTGMTGQLTMFAVLVGSFGVALSRRHAFDSEVA